MVRRKHIVTSPYTAHAYSLLAGVCGDNDWYINVILCIGNWSGVQAVPESTAIIR